MLLAGLSSIFKFARHLAYFREASMNTGRINQLYTFIVEFLAQQNVVNLPVGASVPLPCISNWIILMQRFKGSADFLRNWTDYKNGFGDFAGSDFWIGNEMMHTITNEPGATYRLRVEV